MLGAYQIRGRHRPGRCRTANATIAVITSQLHGAAALLPEPAA
jgi:hypothetical protein